MDKKFLILLAIGLIGTLVISTVDGRLVDEDEEDDDRREDWDKYEPQDRVSRLRALIDRLELRSKGVFLPSE